MAWGITSRRSMTASRYHRRYRPLGVCIGEAGRHRRSRCSGKRICGAAGPRRNPCDRSLPRAGASRGRRGWRFAVAGRGAGITAPISGCSGASRRRISCTRHRACKVLRYGDRSEEPGRPSRQSYTSFNFAKRFGQCRSFGGTPQPGSDSRRHHNLRSLAGSAGNRPNHGPG